MVTGYSNWFACGQGLALLHVNPVLADGTSGLATSATAFAAIEVGQLLAAAYFYRIQFCYSLIPHSCPDIRMSIPDQKLALAWHAVLHIATLRSSCLNFSPDMFVVLAV